MLRSMLSRGFYQRFPALYRLGQKFSEAKGRVLAILLLGLVVSSIQPLSVRLTEKLIRELQKAEGLDTHLFRWLPLFLVGLFVVSGLAKYFYNTLRRTLSEKIIADYREKLFEKYLSLPLASLDKKKTGELLATLQNDLSQISTGIDTLSVVLKEPFTFLGLMAVAFYCDWRLTLATLLVAPLVGILFSRTGSAVKRYSVRNLKNFSELMSLTQESLVGTRVVKVFGLENTLSEQFKKIQDRYLTTAFKSIRVQELATPAVELIGSLLIAGVITYAGFAVSKGSLTSSELVAFIIAIGLAQMPIKELNNSFLKLRNAEAAAERLFSILDESSSEELTLSANPQIKKAQFEKNLRFESVSLAYGEKPVLKDISLLVHRGENIALVGPSGSGKTSFVNLLPRLYELSGGAILLDGVDTRDFDLFSLRRLFSFVTQDTFLFHDTLFNNVAQGKPSASKQEVEKACEMAHCTDFISRLPKGFDTLVGDRGMLLSGGERQRVAIARAFLRNAPILVLDEATSHLDSKSEQIVQEALTALSQGKTTFTIAHRLSTIQKADQILVFEQGSIREQGSHQQLLSKKGHYQEAFLQQ